jgi:outer membrane receptor protein involved in Fe transport
LRVKINQSFMKKLLLSTLLLLLCVVTMHAQVTTSSITGSVRDSRGEALIGATVRATHGPSGTTYGATTNVEGRYNIPNVRIGGPYTIEVSYIGFQNQSYTDITLQLGRPYQLDATLSEGGQQLQEVVVSADRTSLFNSTKTGAATNISSTQIATLPTISRSLTDFTRTTPQANGNSFGGRDPRYNNIQVDGANLNNNFGLSNDPLPGGGAQPISLDAYEEISVNLAPYDVRQAGFTGAGINAVTKSGTNTFRGTAYSFYRDQSFNGTNIGDTDISSQIVNSKNQIYGGSLGGPIIKNKLFFFVNGEYEKGSRPGVTWSPTGGSGNGNISSTTAQDLQRVSDYLRNSFNYDPGAFDNFPNFENQNYKFLAKVDWNISQIHKLTVKYSDFENTNDQAINATSIPNGGGFRPTGQSSNISRLPYSRFSNNSMSFANSNYGFRDAVRTATAELNSNFGGRMSNQLLATLTKINTERTFKGPVFPTVDIFDGQGNNFISFGMDPFTNNNKVINDVYSLTNNFTYYAGKHTFTAGANYEYQRVGNMFMAGSNGYYAFNTLDDFLENRAPIYHAYTYSLVEGEPAVYSANLKIGQLGLYAQDEIQVRPNLNVTAGVRVDRPIYHEQPLENPAYAALQFYDEDNNLRSYSTGSWPKGRTLLSPRVGFRWDAMNDNSLVVRGGTGLFTGRIPFVFLTNMPTNSAMYQIGGAITAPADLADVRFSANPGEYANRFPSTAGTTVPNNANIVFIDENFRFPQVFRTNLAADKELGNGFTFTLEGLYTKDLNAVRMRNANMRAATGETNEGDLSRERFVGTGPNGAVTNADRRLVSNVNTAIVLENVNKGYATSLTAMMSKAFTGGLYGSLAYTYTNAKEITANPGSQATSAWNSNPNVGTSNAIEMGFGQNAIPHRVVANLSYRKEYLNNFASTLSLFYQGSHQNNYSFVVNGDINGDGNSTTDLMYIPRNREEMRFEQYTATINGNVITFTPEQQRDAFEQFINNSDYLKNNRGQFAERNGALMPWYNRLDARFLQDFFITTGKNNTKHTLQFSADVLNVPNMINKNWGIQQRIITSNPLGFRSINADGEPVYRFQQIGGNLVTEPFENLNTLSSTWSMQLGLRYSF